MPIRDTALSAMAYNHVCEIVPFQARIDRVPIARSNSILKVCCLSISIKLLGHYHPSKGSDIG
jgi:hypothetical protein